MSMAELTEQEKYQQKLVALQKYVPFLEKMINHLKNTKEGSREVQLAKMESLYSMITDKKRKLKYDILLKCEEVIVKLQSRMCPNLPCEIRSKGDTNKDSVNTPQNDQQELNTNNAGTLPTIKKQVENISRPLTSKEQEGKREKVPLNTNNSERQSTTRKQIESSSNSAISKEQEEKNNKVRLNTNSESLSKTKQHVDNISKRTSGKAQDNIREVEQELEIKEESFDSDSEKMNNFHRYRRDEFRGRRHVRNSPGYGCKYRPFSMTSVSKQTIILPLLLDVMKSNSNDSSDVALSRSDYHARDEAFSSHSNYDRYSSSPADELGRSRDNYNDSYDDDMRMGLSDRYSSERNDHDRRHELWYGNVKAHNELYQKYEQENDSHSSHRSSPTIGGHRNFDRYDRNMRYDRDEPRPNRDHYQGCRRSAWDTPRYPSYRNENNFRNDFYRRNFGDLSDNDDTGRFVPARSETVPARDGTFKSDDVVQEFNIERDTETRHSEHFLKNDPRAYSKSYNNLTHDKISKTQVDDYANKCVNSMQSNTQIESSSDIRPVQIWGSEYKLSSTNACKTDDKIQDRAQGDPRRKCVELKQEIEENRLKHDSQKLKTSNSEKINTTSAADECKSDGKDLTKGKEIEKVQLPRHEKPATRYNTNATEGAKVQVENISKLKDTISNAKDDDKNDDKFPNADEQTLTYSKYDKIYTNLVHKNVFVSPLEALYSANSGPKKFKIPKKQNPTSLKKDTEVITSDVSKTTEKEENIIPIEETSKPKNNKRVNKSVAVDSEDTSKSKNNKRINKSVLVDNISETKHVKTSKKSKIRKKIINVIDTESDEEENVKESDENIKLVKEIQPDTINSTLFDSEKSTDESQVGTSNTKKIRPGLSESDKAKKLKTETVEKTKTDNLFKSNDNMKTDSVEDKDKEPTQQIPNTDLKSSQESVDQPKNPSCNTGPDKANVESIPKVEDASQESVNESEKSSCTTGTDKVNVESTPQVNEATSSQESSTVSVKQVKEEIMQEINKTSLQETNSIDVLEFILKNYKQIKKIFKDDSSSDEEHSAKKARKKKRKRKKYSSSSSSESEEEKKRKTKRESSTSVEEKQFEKSVSAQKDHKKIEAEVENDTLTQKVPKNKTNIEKKCNKSKFDVLKESAAEVTAIAISTKASSAKGDVKKKTPLEPKHRKSELDILHESIKEMWMCDDIVRATGKRSCTIAKDQTDLRPAKVRKLESIEKFIENAAKLRVIVRREDFTKLLKENNAENDTLHTVDVIKSKPTLKQKRNSVSMDNKKLEDDIPKPISMDNKQLEDHKPKLTISSVRDDKLEGDNTTSFSEVPTITSTSTPVTNSNLFISTANSKTPLSVSSKVVPLSKQGFAKLGKKQSLENIASDYIHQSICNHHDKSYFIHGDKTSCRLCNFSGKLITAHYKTKHKAHEVLTSRMDPSITERLIVESKLKNYETMTLSQGPKCKFSYKCPFCITAFRSDYVSNFYDHITSHTGEYRFYCGNCDYTWHNFRFLQKHYTKHSDKNIPPPKELPPYSPMVFAYVCVECYYVQTLRENIDKHIQRYHENKGDVVKVNLNLVAMDSRNINDDIVTDSSCGASDETELTVNSFPRRQSEECASAELKHVEMEVGQDCSSVKIEDYEIQGVSKDENYTEERNDIAICHTPNLGAFVCETNIVDQNVEEKRLEKMNEILENISIPRASVADKLQTKLVSSETEFVEIQYQSPKKSSNIVLQPSEGVLQHNVNIQAQKAKPSRTFIAESVVLDKNAIEAKITCDARQLNLNKIVASKPVQRTIASNMTDNATIVLAGEGRHNLISQATNKKLTPISSIINRLQDNLQPNSIKKPGKSLNDDQLNKSNNSVQNLDTPVIEKCGAPPQLIHYKELIMEDRKQIQMPRKTYQRVQKVDDPNPHSKKSDQDLPPPSNYDTPTVIKKNGLVLSAGPLKVILGKNNQFIYSCTDCIFLTEDVYAFEAHCKIKHVQANVSSTCSKCGRGFPGNTSVAHIFAHIRYLHFDIICTNKGTEAMARDDGDSVEDSGIENTPNRDSSSCSSLILQNNTADSKYRFVITSVKSLANDSKASSAAGSVHSEISQNTMSENVSDNCDKPPASTVLNQIHANSSLLKPEYIRPVPISKLLDNAEDISETSVTAKVPTATIETKTALSTTYLLHPKRVAHFYKCPVADCRFSCFGSAEFNQHLPLHKDGPVYCLYCAVAVQLSLYMSHLESFHCDSRYACSLCFYRATSPSLVKVHIGLAHVQAKKVMIVETPAATMPARSGPPPVDPPIRDLIKPYICGEPDCKMETIFGSIFLEHYFTIHYLSRNMRCGLCNDKLFKGILQHYWAIHNIYPFQCRYCPSGSHKLHIVVQHQALQHNNLPPCLLSRSPKKNKKNSASSNDEYDDIQILYEKTINLNKLSINTTEAPPNLPENNTLLSNTTTLPLITTTDGPEFETCVSSDDLEASTTNPNHNEIESISLDYDTELMTNAGENLCSSKFPNTIFSASAEENLKTSVVDKKVKKTLKVLKPVKRPPDALATKFTCVICLDQFVHKTGAVEHMKQFHTATESENGKILKPKCNEKESMKYYTLVDGTIYPSCKICGLHVIRKRCEHVTAVPDGVTTITGTIEMTSYIYPSLKTAPLRKMVAEALIIPSYVPQNTYWCGQPGCEKAYKTADTFGRHLRALHLKDEYFNCIHCGVQIETKSKLINIYAIHKHFELHGPNLFQCYFCHFFDVVVYSMKLHINVVHPSKSPTDYHIIRFNGQPPQIDSAERPSSPKMPGNSAPNIPTQSILLNTLLTTTSEASSSHVNAEEVDSAAIIVSDDSEDDENCQTVVQSDIVDVPSIPKDDMSFSDMSLNEVIAEDVTDLQTDLNNDIGVTNTSDNLMELLDENVNEDCKEQNEKIECVFIEEYTKEEVVGKVDEEFHFSDVPCKTYPCSKNKMNSSTTPSKTSTLADLKSDVEKDGCHIETIVIDDNDEDCNTQNRTSGEGLEDIVRSPDSKIVEKKINFIKPKAFSSKALIEENISKAIISPSNLNLQTVSNKLQKAMSYGQDESSNNMINDGEFVCDPIGEPDDVPVDPLMIDEKSGNSDFEPDDDFTFGRPSGPFAQLSMNCYKCPLCSYQTSYSREFYTHLNIECIHIQDQISKQHCPIKNRRDWARSVLVCQTKILNFWRDSITSEDRSCRFCPVLYRNYAIRRHEGNHFDARPFCCRYCNWSCIVEKDLIVHWRKCHPKILNPSYEVDKTKDFSVVPNPNAITNDFFLMTFLASSDFEDLDEPVSSYLQTVLSSLWEFMGNYSPPDKNIRVACKQYLCKECNKCYYNRNLLKLHMKKHYRVYKCKYCDFTGYNYRVLRKHHFDKHEQNFEFLYDFFVESRLNKILEEL